MDINATEIGGEKLSLDGFMYTVKYENKSKTEATWRCVRRVADSCHAILKTTNDEVSTLAKPHNHPSDKTAVEIEKCRQIMKQQANSTNDRPNQILTFSTATAIDEVKARLPQPDTVKRVLRLNFRRIPPLFPLHRWNMHEVTINPEPTMFVKTGTTNFTHLWVTATQPSGN